MDIFNTKKVKGLEKQLGKIQKLINDDILTVKETGATYVGNDYKTYEQAIDEIEKKYNATADWGVLQTGNIIELRAAFIIAQGIVIIAEDKAAKAELDWCNDFLRFNDLDREVVQEFAIEAEIEGKLLASLTWDETAVMSENGKEKKGMVKVRFVSWSTKRYTIETAEDDYLDYTKASWEATGDKKAGSLAKEEFVYKKFGGRINKPNDAAPKVMKCLTQIDNLDKALRDWREIDNLFATPVPDIEVADADEAKEAQETLENRNWKLRKAFIHTGKFSFKGPDMKGTESLENEIVTLAKMISGTTGVPIHFLGLTELLKQRATADNLREMISSATTKERETWKGAYEEMIEKGMAIHNSKVNKQMSNQKKLDPKKVRVEIPQVSRDQWERLEKVWLPAVVAGKVSQELFLSQIPGIDPDKELKAQEKKDKLELEAVKVERDGLKEERDLAAAGAIPPAGQDQGGQNAV